MNHYQLLLSRLDAFIRKYYINQLLRGGLILLICALAYVLLASVGEYFLYLPVAAKLMIVGAFVILGGSALIFWIIIPLTKMLRLGNALTHEQAAGIIGRHFPEISDKLLNILQLKNGHELQGSPELIAASIDQKAGQISVVPITRAVDLSKNKKYLPYLLPVVLAGVFILVAAPNVFKDASTRLLQPTRTFERPAPFQFIISSQPLTVVRNNDFLLKANVQGSALPAELSVEISGERIPMTALDNHGFQYSFKNVTEPVTFRLFGAGFYSQPYTLKVAQKPVLKAIKVQLFYPDYTGRKNEIRTSLGDMTLPEGTGVGYAIAADYTDFATLHWAAGSTITLPHQGSLFGYQCRFMADTSYTISLQNKASAVADSFRYSVHVIRDQYPVLQVQEFRDTVVGKQIVITGTAGDDYGITRVQFHYSISNDKGRQISEKSLPLKTAGGALTTFQQYFDVAALDLQPGQKVSYFIEAWDNDGVHGPKASRSEVMTYSMFTPHQLDSAMNVNSKQINSGLSNSAEQTQQLQEEMKDVQTKMLQSSEMDYQQQQNMQQLAEKQQELQKQMEATKKRLDEQTEQSKQKPYSDDVRAKQEELKQQMDNLMNKELQEQMKKLQELMAKLNKEDAVQNMQQMQEENKLFNMDLQRMQELMKKLEMQMRMEDLANKMDKLAADQKDLQKQTDAKQKDNAALGKDQKDLKQQLSKAMNEDMKEMQKLNQESKQNQDLKQPQKEGEQAQQQMQQSEDQLGEQQNSQSSESQKKAAQNLQDMANQLRSQAGGQSMQQLDMNIRAVRQILSNLIRLSFDQEALMSSVRQTPASSPTYLANQTEQNRLHGNSVMIRDSLFVLSKRIFTLSRTVNKETTDLENNMKRATASLENRLVGDALTRQQYVMTHTNNLALMLNEILQNLIQQQNQSQDGKSGNCSMPGGKKPKPGAGQQMSDIITQQQSLGNAMQQAQSAAQRKQGGQKPGSEGKPGKDGQGKEPGQNGKPGGSGDGSSDGSSESDNAEQIARLAAQQAAVRRKLQQLQNEMNGRGGNAAAKELREIQQQMDKNETDLVNRRLGSEFQQRQRDIMTRLLESEKAVREQEQDDKRSSNAAKEISRPVPPELQQYLQNRQAILDLYRTVPPQLKPYYKSMVDQYFKSIGNGK